MRNFLGEIFRVFLVANVNSQKFSYYRVPLYVRQLTVCVVAARQQM